MILVAGQDRRKFVLFARELCGRYRRIMISNERIASFTITPSKHQVGTSIYYYRYSTWKGKRLYLEDLVVTEKKCGTGAGKKLFEETLEIGKRTNCTGMMWQVLDWNQPAINFYKKYNSHFEDKWINCNIDF